MPANRVAAIATWLTGLVAFITGVTSALPSGWQDKAGMIAGIITQLIVAIHFMTGSQKFDALALRQANLTDDYDPSTEAEVAVSLAPLESAVTPDAPGIL